MINVTAVSIVIQFRKSQQLVIPLLSIAAYYLSTNYLANELIIAKH